MLNDIHTFDPLDLLLINSDQAWHYRVIPQKTGTDLAVFTDNEDALMKEELEFVLGQSVKIKIIDTDFINKHLHKHYPRAEESERAAVRTYTGSSDNFLNDLISEAKRLKSSDIHMEV